MKKLNRLRVAFLLFAVLAMQPICFAQIEDIGKFLAGGEEDAKLLLEPYISPAVNAFGAALGSGWYNTAKPHKLGGFDITFTSNIAIIPSKYEKFTIDDSKLTTLKLADQADNITPTIAGDNSEGPQLVYKVGEFTQNAFQNARRIKYQLCSNPDGSGRDRTDQGYRSHCALHAQYQLTGQ